MIIPFEWAERPYVRRQPKGSSIGQAGNRWTGDP